MTLMVPRLDTTHTDGDAPGRVARSRALGHALSSPGRIGQSLGQGGARVSRASKSARELRRTAILGEDLWPLDPGTRNSTDSRSFFTRLSTGSMQNCVRTVG